MQPGGILRTVRLRPRYTAIRMALFNSSRESRTIMGNRLYVGNLSYDTSKETLEAAFASAGTVEEVFMPTDRETGRFRGFAFVTMGSTNEANSAIAQFDGSMLDGRTLKVNEAMDRPAGGGRGKRF